MDIGVQGTSMEGASQYRIKYFSDITELIYFSVAMGCQVPFIAVRLFTASKYIYQLKNRIISIFHLYYLSNS